MDMSFNDPGVFAPADAGTGLRPLMWHDLCARISAAQDLRRALDAGRGGDEALSPGSFHGMAAHIIASGFPGISAHGGMDEALVNPTSSANGKGLLGTQEFTNGRNAVGPR
ncbi:MAG: hypothetical protein RIS85_432 [Pseudomonadota bacterium]|jgi:hypothetical protein